MTHKTIYYLTIGTKAFYVNGIKRLVSIRDMAGLLRVWRSRQQAGMKKAPAACMIKIERGK